MEQKLTRLIERIKARRWLRKIVGVLLVVGGILGPFLPVLGVWMLPLGLVLLSADYPWAQRYHARFLHWYEHYKKRLKRR